MKNKNVRKAITCVLIALPDDREATQHEIDQMIDTVCGDIFSLASDDIDEVIKTIACTVPVAN